jgi:hypothetical protein
MKENDHYIVKEDVVIAEEHPELPEADIQEIVNNFNIEEHERKRCQANRLPHERESGAAACWLRRACGACALYAEWKSCPVFYQIDFISLNPLFYP